MFYMQLYIIFGTSLFTQCQVSAAVFFAYFLFEEISTRRSRNAMKHFNDLFPDKRHPRSFGKRPEGKQGDDKAIGRPNASWAPPGSVWPNSTSINSLKSGNQQRVTRNTFSGTACFCSSMVPSGGLFRYSVAAGIDHRGLLHQPCCPSDDVWVVYHRPMRP